MLLKVYTILTHEVARNIFLWKEVYSVSSDFAWSLLKIKYLTKNLKVYVFK